MGAGAKAQIALPVITDADGRTEDAATTAAHATAAWSGTVAPLIRMLPELFPAASLVAGVTAAGGCRSGCASTTSRRSSSTWSPATRTCWSSARPLGVHATLRAVVSALCAAYSPDELRVYVVDYRRTLLDAVPPEHASVYLGPALPHLTPRGRRRMKPPVSPGHTIW